MQKVFAFRGYYVAVYTRPAAGSRYVGHAAICVEHPEDPEHANALERVASVGSYTDEERALQAAEFQARSVIDGLQPNWAPFTAPGALASRH
jgi:hypothetical protein